MDVRSVQSTHLGTLWHTPCVWWTVRTSGGIRWTFIQYKPQVYLIATKWFPNSTVIIVGTVMSHLRDENDSNVVSVFGPSYRERLDVLQCLPSIDIRGDGVGEKGWVRLVPTFSSSLKTLHRWSRKRIGQTHRHNSVVSDGEVKV